MAKDQCGGGKGQNSGGIVQKNEIKVTYGFRGIRGEKKRTLPCPDIVGKSVSEARTIAQEFAMRELARIHPNREVNKVKVTNL